MAEIIELANMLEKAPVLLGTESYATMHIAQRRARTLRDALAAEGLHVRARTWPILDENGVMVWRWCVFVPEDDG
jgi:hypothetical protein